MRTAHVGWEVEICSRRDEATTCQIVWELAPFQRSRVNLHFFSYEMGVVLGLETMLEASSLQTLSKWKKIFLYKT